MTHDKYDGLLAIIDTNITHGAAANDDIFDLHESDTQSILDEALNQNYPYECVESCGSVACDHGCFVQRVFEGSANDA